MKHWITIVALFWFMYSGHGLHTVGPFNDIKQCEWGRTWVATKVSGTAIVNVDWMSPCWEVR
jgi:hypothetical protein